MAKLMDRVEYRRTADGRLVPKEDQTQFLLILGILLAALLVIAGVIAFLTLHPASKNTPAAMAAESMVRSQLESTSGGDIRLYFQPQNEINVTSLGEGKYQVSGWVDEITNGGGTQRLGFSCVILLNSNGRWTSERLSIFPES